MPELDRSVDLASERVLALSDPFRSLLPEGVRRGSTVTVTGSMALAMAVTAGLAGEAGGDHWVAGVGWGSRAGLMAAHELGVPWERLVLVAAPDDRRGWATVASVVVDAFDVVVVVVHPGVGATGTTARRLAARARERGTVVIVVEGPDQRLSGHLAPEVALRVVDGRWEGVGRGHGRLRARRVVVEASGRGRLVRPRRATLWLPAPDGGVRLADETPPATFGDGPVSPVLGEAG